MTQPLPPQAANVLLDRVRDMLAAPVDTLPNAWARAAALLLRQTLEGTLADLWLRKAPSLENASFSAQLACLREFTSDAQLVADTTYTWHTLSAACHHRGYGLPPARDTLHLWLATVERLVDGLAAQ